MESVFATLQINALINLIPNTNKSRKAPDHCIVNTWLPKGLIPSARGQRVSTV